MSSGSTPPLSTLETALNAAKRKLSFTPLKAGELVRDTDAAAHPKPDDDPVVIGVTLSGIVDGTVHIAVGDEFLERLEYTSKTDRAIDALSPAFDAIVGALKPLGSVKAGDCFEVDDDDWPGADGSLAVISGPLTDGSDHVVQIAFALDYQAVKPGSTERDPDDTETFTIPDHPSRPDAARAGIGRAGSRAGAAGTSDELGEVAAAAIARLADVEVEVAAVLGEARIPLHELLDWLPGSIVQLERAAGTPADLCVGSTVMARGDVVAIDENYGIRITETTMQGPSAPSVGLSRP